jgi:hypothetical protein
MEPEVAEFASSLISDNPEETWRAYQTLKDFGSKSFERQEASFSRLVQELAIYKQGLVIQTLLKQAVLCKKDFAALFSDQSTSSEEVLVNVRALVSFKVLTSLAASKAVGQSCMRSQDTAKRLVEDPHGSQCSLEGLLHFARASKLIRESMRASVDLLPSLEHFLSEKYMEKVDLDVFLRARKYLAQLVEALTMSEDSRSWIIEVGYMKLLAGLYRTAHLQQDEEATDASSIALLRLSRFPKCVELMKKHRVHLLMEPHSTIIESSFPKRGFWKDFERRIRAGICESSCDLKYCKNLAKLERSIVYETPTVCSWGGCTIQLQAALSKTTKFSKCARCSIAHYCR